MEYSESSRVKIYRFVNFNFKIIFACQSNQAGDWNQNRFEYWDRFDILHTEAVSGSDRHTK